MISSKEETAHLRDEINNISADLSNNGSLQQQDEEDTKNNGVNGSFVDLSSCSQSTMLDSTNVAVQEEQDRVLNGRELGDGKDVTDVVGCDDTTALECGQTVDGGGASHLKDDEESKKSSNELKTSVTSVTPVSTVPSVIWSEVLCSPTKGDAFSPSKEMNKSGSLHGYGLTTGVERAKTLSRCSKKCSSLIHTLSELYDSFAQSLSKSCQNIPPPGTTPTPLHTLSRDVSKCITSFANQTQGLGICLKSGVSSGPFETISSSHSNFSNTTPDESIDRIYQTYVTSRDSCHKTRNTAMKARLKYVKAIRDAENAIKDLKKAKIAAEKTRIEQEDPDTPSLPDSTASAPPIGGLTRDSSDPSTKSMSSWQDMKKKMGSASLSKSIERVMSTLNNVKTLESTYAAAVHQENDIVQHCIMMERTALDSLRNWEDQRQVAFFDAMIGVLTAETGALDNMTLALRRSSNTTEGDEGGTATTNGLGEQGSSDVGRAESPPSSKGLLSTPTRTPLSSSASTTALTTTNSPFIFMQKRTFSSSDYYDAFASSTSSSSSNNNSSGAVEASQWELPEGIGALRDKVRGRLGDMGRRVEVMKSLIQFVDELATAVSVLAGGLQNKLSQEGYTTNTSKNTDVLALALKSTEGKRALKAWTIIIDTFISLVSSLVELSMNLRSNVLPPLENHVKDMEKELKSQWESEDTRWRQVCDAARSETKMRMKKEQCARDIVKTREKLSNLEDEVNSEEDEVSSSSSSLPPPPISNSSSSSSSFNPTMRKALGNMFSILPGGGEDVMTKMLNSKARLAITKTNLNDASHKMDNATTSHDAAREAKRRAVAYYETRAKELIEVVLVSQETSMGEFCERCCVDVVEGFQEYRVQRYVSLKPGKQVVDELKKEGKEKDMAEWIDMVTETMMIMTEANKEETQDEDHTVPPSSSDVKQKERRKSRVDFTGGATKKPKKGVVQVDAGAGFQLSVILEKSTSVDTFVTVLTSNADFTKTAKQHDASTKLEQDPMDTTHNLGDSSADDDAHKDKDNKRTLNNGSNGQHKAPQIIADADDKRELEEYISLAQLVKDSTALDNQSLRKQPSQPLILSQSTITTVDANTEVFNRHFNLDDCDNIPSDEKVIESFSCAYWPKDNEGYLSPLLHGRLFAGDNALYFVGWGDKKIVCRWSSVTMVTKEATMMGAIENAIRVTYRMEDGTEGNYFFGSFVFRENCYRLLNKLMTIAQSLDAIKKTKESTQHPEGLQLVDGQISTDATTSAKQPKALPQPLPKVPKDDTLKKMEIVTDKKIKHVTIQQFAQIVWHHADFYETWCNARGNHEVTVSDWEISDIDETAKEKNIKGGESTGFVNPWDGETYTRRRTVTFKYTRTTHLYIGPPIASVKQTHYYRIENNNKCVVAMTVKMEGIPYADVFCVEVRWVARRVDKDDLRVESGVFVDFKKSSMLKKQIRDGTLKETAPTNVDFMEKIKAACAQYRKKIASEMTTTTATATTAVGDNDNDNDDDLVVDDDDDDDDELSKDDTTDKCASKGFLQRIIAIILSPFIQCYSVIRIKITSDDYSKVRKAFLPIVVYIMLYFVWSYISSLRDDGIFSSRDSRMKFMLLEKKVDAMRDDMEEMKKLLSQMLVLLKEKER